MGGEVCLALLTQELPDLYLRPEATDELGGVDAHGAWTGVDHLLLLAATHHVFCKVFYLITVTDQFSA